MLVSKDVWKCGSDQTHHSYKKEYSKQHVIKMEEYYIEKRDGAMGKNDKI